MFDEWEGCIIKLHASSKLHLLKFARDVYSEILDKGLMFLLASNAVTSFGLLKVQLTRINVNKKQPVMYRNEQFWFM